ncbi:phosphoglycolate phosphatase [Halapricum hydrolyticum]|uniref:Phosphoglycolate phosphatase n=1 Tax=Halapricum hydrolyticum TaxID=2979991 RepID=A0AAE3I9H2_9EURY|nr:phosphoglycolate phosphatase [Halapricum hydrolyticum]MCU4716474.1 phosphoglycolate phosphatase [Halapricum hydrolyticum]MCU4725922.1 phosphoglycolate phosphatase [Halapricum hydrolyticum]
MMDAPPLAVDVDGTLTDGQGAIDHRVLPVLREWPAPVVVATGKSMPYPIALCQFAGIEGRVIAENGGVVAVADTDTLRFEGDRAAAQAVADAYVEAGYSLGWREIDFVNRWRETEIAVAREQPLAPLESIAAERGLEVVDTGYAYHVKSPDVSKGQGLEVVADELGLDPAAFLAVGDSENDVSTFEVAGEAVAVANADDAALAAADRVTDDAYADGFFEAIGVDPIR